VALQAAEKRLAFVSLIFYVTDVYLLCWCGILPFFLLSQVESDCLNTMGIGKSLFVCSEENYSRIIQPWVEKLNADMKLNDMQKKRRILQRYSYGNIH